MYLVDRLAKMGSKQPTGVRPNSNLILPKSRNSNVTASSSVILSSCEQREQFMGTPENEDQNGKSRQLEDSFSMLIGRARSGDQQAVGELCQIAQKYLLLIANQDLNSQVLQKLGASDVVQQSMLVANNKMEQFQGRTKGEFFAWMRQIVINECRQATRGFQQTVKRDISRERSISKQADESTQFQLNDPYLTPSTTAANDEQSRLVNLALARLEPLQRQVIELRNWEELSFEDIGRKIGKSGEATRKIWSRAIVKLEQELKTLNAI